MTFARSGTIVSALRTNAARELPFAAGLMVIGLSALQYMVLRGTFAATVASSAPDKAVVLAPLVELVMWADVVIRPLVFLGQVALMTGIVWAVGTLTDQEPGFRPVVNVATSAELLNFVAHLGVMLAWRFELINSSDLWTYVGSGPSAAGDTIMDAMWGSLVSPILWVWMAALALALKHFLKWPGRAVILSTVSALVFRVSIDAALMQFAGSAL